MPAVGALNEPKLDRDEQVEPEVKERQLLDEHSRLRLALPRRCLPLGGVDGDRLRFETLEPAEEGDRLIWWIRSIFTGWIRPEDEEDELEETCALLSSRVGLGICSSFMSWSAVLPLAPTSIMASEW